MEFYGNYPIFSETGVDLTLLKRNLALTPTERWKKNFRAVEMIEAFQEAGRAERAELLKRLGQHRVE